MNNVTSEDVESFSSRSRPVAAAARRQHNEMLKRLKQPWWKSLSEETDERDLEHLRDVAKRACLDDEVEKQF